VRIALGIEYRGGAYQGWERQTNGPTVQAALETALAFVANHPIRTVCAGRTDSGVHAWGQVVHFDTEAKRELRSWILGPNTRLPDDVSVVWAHEVDDNFSARFSATARRYRYIFYNRQAPPAVLNGLVTPSHSALDATLMNDAAQALVGQHDFTSYRAKGCQAHSPVRTIHTCQVTREGEFLFLDVCANAFLQHMVRNIAGVLMAIGRGERPPYWAADVLDGKDRAEGGVTAPPHGLYLMSVDYPAQWALPVVSRHGGLW
jgi:tRNA pseudouridine38-40 synthase